MKDFDSWNVKKKLINSNKPRLYTVREIWWCSLGINVGSEQDGGGEEFLRPVLILRSFGANSCLVIPLTKSTHKHLLRIPLGVIDGENATVILSQMKVVDTRRLVEKIGFLDKEKFAEIRKAVKKLF